MLLRYLERMTRLSRQQVTRLVRQYRQDGMLSHRPCPPRYGFLRRFTTTDVAAPADMGAWHGTMSGLATKKLMERAFLVFTDARFERLAEISWLPPVQPAGRDPVPTHTATLDQDAANRRAHRPASHAATEWDAGLYPHRQCASERPTLG